MAGIKFDDRKFQQEFEEFMNETLPQTFNDIFGDITQQMRTAAELTSAIDAQIESLTEAMMTPAQRFEEQMDELAALQAQMLGAGPEETLQTASQISQLVGSLFQLVANRDVFGQDIERFTAVQDDLIQVLRDLRSSSLTNILGPLAPSSNVTGATPPAAVTQSSSSISIAINPTTGMSPRDIADEVIRLIEQRSAFGQTTIITR